MSGSGTGSSPRPAATRWLCLSWSGGGRRRSWPAGSGSSARHRSRGASRRHSGGASTLSQPGHGTCCSSLRPIQSANRAWCGRQPGSSASAPRQRRRRPRPGWPSSAPGCGSGTHWSARPPTDQPHRRTGRTCTAPWPRSPTRTLIRTAGPGTWPRPRPGLMSRSPPSWNARPAGRWRAEGWPRRLLAAARAKRDAGALDEALGLLVAVEAGPPDVLRTAEVEHLRGQIAFDQGRISDAARLMLSAARRLEPLDAGSARETHLEALAAALWASDVDGPAGVLETAEAARAAPAGPQPPRVVDVLLDAFALRLTEGY